jgi:hypothetical protein
MLSAAAPFAALVSVALGTAACGGRSTTSTTTTGSKIVVNHSVGPISIGLDRRQVSRLLGRPESTLAVFSSAREPGTLARYRSHGADMLIVYDSAGRVASIETYSSYYRTKSGVGPGSPLGLAARLRGFNRNSCDLGYWNATQRTNRRGVVTVFTPNGGLVSSALVTQLRFDTTCAQAGRGLEPRPNIVVDVSIGGVRLGVSEAAVQNLFGRAARVSGTRSRYTVDGAPFVVTYDAAGHVVEIQAFSTFFFTPAGIGPGTPLSFLAAAHMFALDPCKTGFWNAPARASPTSAVTAFTLRARKVASVVIGELRLVRRCSTR